MSHKPVKIGVVGVGSFGRMHARTIAGMAEAELAGVVYRSDSSIEELRKSVPDVPAWHDLDQALDQCKADAWVIATRTDTHVPIAEKILKRGLATLIEKPLSTDVQAAERLRPLVKPDSSNVLMGHIVLFSSKFKWLMKEAQRRGGIRYFHAFRHRPQFMSETFAEETPLRMTMVHDFYQALALMNGQEPEYMTASMRPLGDTGRFDLALAEMHWKNDTWGSFTASFLTPPGMPGDGFDRFEIFGDGWAGRTDLNPQPLQLYTDKVEWPMGLEIDDDPVSPSGFLAEELRHFCRVVQGRAQVPLGCRYEDAITIQRWVDRLEAIARGEARK